MVDKLPHLPSAPKLAGLLFLLLCFAPLFMGEPITMKTIRESNLPVPAKTFLRLLPLIVIICIFLMMRNFPIK